MVELIGFEDPAGIRTEVYYGQPINQRPFQPSRAISGFKTGNMGIGHLVVHQPDLEASLKFYTDLLGFQVSDVVEPAGNPMGVFLHCNPRHHSIALFGAGGAHKRINHFMLEQRAGRRRHRARLARRKGTPLVITSAGTPTITWCRSTCHAVRLRGRVRLGRRPIDESSGRSGATTLSSRSGATRS